MQERFGGLKEGRTVAGTIALLNRQVPPTLTQRTRALLVLLGCHALMGFTRTVTKLTRGANGSQIRSHLRCISMRYKRE